MALPSFFVFHAESIRQVGEEIVSQYVRYACEQAGVYRRAVEYVVNVLTFAMQLSGKPCYRVCLGMSVEFGLYHLAHVTGFSHTSIFVVSRTSPSQRSLHLPEHKKRRTMCSLSYPRHRQTPYLK